jgi:hypothetical protein
LLEQIARTSGQPSKVKIVTPFPWYENEPIDIELISTSENISLSADSIPISLREDVSFDNVWHARTWAGAPGWHLLETSDGTSVHYYISNPAQWKTLSLVNQQNKNKIYAGRRLDRPLEEIDVWEEIPALIFYIMFLLATGFLWLSPKL